MSLRVTFKPGALQSMHAARYFNEAAGNLLEGWIERLEAQLYTMGLEDGSTMHLHVWSEEELNEDQLQQLFVWLMVLNEDIARSQKGRLREEEVRRMVANWLAFRHGGISFLAERSVLPSGGAAGERAELSLGVIGGRTVLVSTETMMFTRLTEGVYGLTMAGKGSYLVEDVQDGGTMLRRA